MGNKKAIVVSGDYGYIRQIETTIKSLCCHHKNLDIYVFNQDIPQEWFYYTRRKVEAAGSQLNDVKLFNDQVKSKWEAGTYAHINYMAYGRYFIPNYVAADKVLYLDCDIVVTRNLDHLFEMDLEDYYVATIRATYGVGLGFNSGVMLINNKRWREENMAQQLVELTDRELANFTEGDQSILNLMFEGKKLDLEDTYNFQIGFDMGAALDKHDWIFEIPLSPLPAVLHYISGQKPWDTVSNMRLREVWWFYNTLDWSTIIETDEFGVEKAIEQRDEGFALHCVTLTNSDRLEGIEYLVKALPNCLFHIAAYTQMSDKLLKLMAYENVRLHPVILPYPLKDLLASSDIYLDINHDQKFDTVIREFQESGKPVYAFDNVQTEGISEQVFSHENYQEMVEKFDQILSKGRTSPIL